MAVRRRLEVTFPNAAGIDVGGSNHMVAVPPDRDGEPVREFGVFTQDLEAIADWLAACGGRCGDGIHRGVLDSAL